MTTPARHQVRQSFERAAATYDNAAQVQRLVCHALARRLPAALPASSLLLDAGCGTGYALPLLHKCAPESAVLALDLAPAMLERANGTRLKLQGDLEALPLAAASIDLYWSSLAWQWCDPVRALAEARRVLRPTGHFLLASLGPGTFSELRHAFSAVDDRPHTLNFLSANALQNLAYAAGFPALRLECQRETLHYPDLRTLLRAVKAVGANQLGRGRRAGLMGRAALARLTAAYESQRTDAGLPLSYDLVFLSGSA